MSTIIKENYKKILLVILLILLLPVIEVVIKIITTYGNIVGTYARQIIENGICR